MADYYSGKWFVVIPNPHEKTKIYLTHNCHTYYVRLDLSLNNLQSMSDHTC